MGDVREDDLAKCPFCGGKALHDVDVTGIHTIFCATNTCGAEMMGVRETEVRTNWNTRYEHKGHC